MPQIYLIKYQNGEVIDMPKRVSKAPYSRHECSFFIDRLLGEFKFKEPTVRKSTTEHKIRNV